MRFDILTLFPDMVQSVLSESIIGRAQKAGFLSVHCHQIRDFSENKHHNVDDTPYGGGVGMVMAAGPICSCFDAAVAEGEPNERRKVIYLSPRGRIFSQEMATEFAAYDRLILLCGHYEGVDERAIEEIGAEEISIGDYVLTGGELPACVLIDSVSRLLEGTLASKECYEGESVASGILEYPQYTKPREWMGRCVPDVLLDGDHAKIDRYRLECAVELTRERRPDMLQRHPEILESLAPKKKKKK